MRRCRRARRKLLGEGSQRRIGTRERRCRRVGDGDGDGRDGRFGREVGKGSDAIVKPIKNEYPKCKEGMAAVMRRIS